MASRSTTAGTFHGGSYTRIRPQFYRKHRPAGLPRPGVGDYDVLEAVLPSARKRGMKTICWFEDVFRDDTPNIRQLQEKTLDGRNATTLCFNNPNYRSWLLGTVEDYARSYDIDGIMWGSERQGAFANAIGSSHGGASRDPAGVTLLLRVLRAQGARAGHRSRAGQNGIPKPWPPSFRLRGRVSAPWMVIT